MLAQGMVKQIKIIISHAITLSSRIQALGALRSMRVPGSLVDGDMMQRGNRM